MRKSILFTTIALFGSAGTARAAVVTTVTGTYDSTSNANAVDFSAPFTAATGTASAANVLTASAFTTAVATANAAGLGGVVDFETNTGSSATADTVTATYGTGKSLLFTSTTSSNPVTNTTQLARTPISGVTFLNKFTGGATPNDYGFAVGFPTGISIPEGVVSLGLTMLSRTDGTGTAGLAFGTVTATATFSGGGTVSSARSISELAGAGDTFYGFTAPAGQTITSVFVDVPGTANYSALDDLAFVTATGVPEPAACGTIGLAAGTGLLRRKRRRRERRRR